MDISQGNSLYSYFKQTQRHFLNKIREHGGRTGPVWGFGISGRGQDVGKRCRTVTMVQILCTHVCKWKNKTC
jgi:hypothetical protein